MESNGIKLESVTPSIAIGRCVICRQELATKMLTIDNVQTICFCDKCFNLFRDVININTIPKKEM